MADENPNSNLIKMFTVEIQPTNRARIGQNRDAAAAGSPTESLSVEKRCWLNNIKNVSGLILGVVSEECLANFKSDSPLYVTRACDLSSFCREHVKPEDVSCEWNVFDEMREQLAHSLCQFTDSTF